MAEFGFNIAKGAWAYYATLPAANDALIAVPIEISGSESDAILKDYDTLSAILAGPTNEQTTMGRKTLAGITVTTDDTTDKKVLDFNDIVWTGATGNATSRLLFCYDPDTTGGTDADIIPLFSDDFPVTPGGGDVTYQVHASGLADAS